MKLHSKYPVSGLFFSVMSMPAAAVAYLVYFLYNVLYSNYTSMYLFIIDGHLGCIWVLL